MSRCGEGRYGVLVTTRAQSRPESALCIVHDFFAEHPYVVNSGEEERASEREIWGLSCSNMYGLTRRPEMLKLQGEKSP